jgi:hypothetical protein
VLVLSILWACSYHFFLISYYISQLCPHVFMYCCICLSAAIRIFFWAAGRSSRRALTYMLIDSLSALTTGKRPFGDKIQPATVWRHNLRHRIPSCSYTRAMLAETFSSMSGGNMRSLSGIWIHRIARDARNCTSISLQHLCNSVDALAYTGCS